MKSNTAKKNQTPSLTRKAALAFAVYAILDADLAVVLNNFSVSPSLEEKDAQCRSSLRSQVAVSDV